MTTRPFAAVRGGGGGAWVREKSVSGLLFLRTLSRMFLSRSARRYPLYPYTQAPLYPYTRPYTPYTRPYTPYTNL